MSRRTLTPALATALLLGALGAANSPAAAAMTFIPCPQSAGFYCASLPVPLERSGDVPGAISLSVQLKPAAATRTRSAVLALAGGPGQAILPLGEFVARAMAPALESRDLLLFDQRGTGESEPLTCPALGAPAEGSEGRVLEQCAGQIGPARGAYTTQESVSDIESIRQASGYEKLVLYGTSYGTKVALEYAERYPEHVEALVLDSVVPTSGPEPFAVATFQAIGPVLHELCSQHVCAGITTDPLRDLARLAAQLRRHALSGSAYDGSGHRSTATLTGSGLLDILQAGDLNPALRALLPGAVGSALRHDPDPLLRLHLLSEGLIPSVPKQPVEGPSPVDEALFVATSCEETPFPWQRTASASVRLAEALADVHALPSADFYPFDAPTAWANGLVPDCAFWPDASQPPPAASPLPSVPTLILSGAQDLRTPTSGARHLAEQIPGSQLVVVPYTGHSVLGSDFSGCAEAAVKAFFSAGSVRPCGAGRNLFAPTPIAPTNLAAVRAPPGLAGQPGRTLTAVLDAILDLDRQVVAATLEADQELPSGSSFGGLRGGYAKLSSSQAILSDFSFVPGVKLSGNFPVRNGELQPASVLVSGADASPGVVRFGTGKHVTGTLGGRSFDVSLAKVQLSRAGAGGGWPARPLAFPLPGLIERALGGARE